jgi:putative FmdB family regulatory protein
MPKYVYKCNNCEEHFEIYHGMTEVHEECIHCSAKDLIRQPQMPFIKRQTVSRGSKVGDEVKAAIEANKTVLKDIKEQAKEDYYIDDN